MIYARTFVILAAIVAGTIPALHAGWNYDGSDNMLDPAHWMYNYSSCNGTSQSPINIVTATATALQANNVNLTFSNYNTVQPQSFNVMNTGHTVQVNVQPRWIGVSRSDLGGDYKLEQFHFHWGVADSNGSEHSIDGRFHPLEIHFVHFNSAKYNNVSHAATSTPTDSSAIIVLGVFVDVASASTSSNMDLEKLINATSLIRYESNTTSIAAFSLNVLIPTSSRVYTYQGSLTTPGCQQVVNWNVFEQPIYVSSEKLESFRQVHGDNNVEELKHNFRPLQPLNGRSVSWYNVGAAGDATAAPTTAAGVTNVNGASSVRVGQATHVALLAVALFAVAFK